MPADAAVAIRCADLRKSFGDIAVLRGVSLCVPDGQHVSIQGVSGSGKSTLLNLLALMDRPTSGLLELYGHDTAAMSDRDRARVRSRLFGFVFQQFNLVGERSVYDNVALGLLYAGVPRRAWHERVREAVDYVRLGHRIAARGSTLSGGEQQRAAIARAIATKPRVLVCDEPTGSLDSATARAVLGLLERLNADGITVVVTHDPDVAERAERRVHMTDGVVTPSTPVS